MGISRQAEGATCPVGSQAARSAGCRGGQKAAESGWPNTGCFLHQALSKGTGGVFVILSNF